MTTENYFPNFTAACNYLEHLNRIHGFRRYDAWPRRNHATGWELEKDPKEFCRRVFELRDKGPENTDDRYRALLAYAEALAEEMETAHGTA